MLKATYTTTLHTVANKNIAANALYTLATRRLRRFGGGGSPNRHNRDSSENCQNQRTDFERSDFKTNRHSGQTGRLSLQRGQNRMRNNTNKQ